MTGISVFMVIGVATFTLLHGCDDTTAVSVEDDVKTLKDKVAALEFQVRQLLGGNLMQARRSCSDWFRDGFVTSGNYLIDPDGLRGVSDFLVWCDMTLVPPIAVIHHDKENRTLVTGFEGYGAYSHDVSYASSSQHIRALMARSGPCHQQLKYECHGSVIRPSVNGSGTYSYWIANGQEVTSYWPGGNAQLGGCACYQTKSCAGGKKCNCDMNDAVWREDSGPVTDKDVLPITGLRIGDTGDASEKVYITLGPLMCEN
ncbi:contactin-associated protein 1-like isoform X1 [Lingula anatina]|uniref:Contactin-associated protein 1-like isoform X1 n=1 Tax=Lingula anatina TaxID=7574 RepID=A0A1S3I6L6_LINAN|nr:contactin-associated protein 1-like isoform X1 [Lingula anatina]|eukprot:XP_013393848.1 contactin-associated protein 1-like isoform X1 [Lingula anatina]